MITFTSNKIYTKSLPKISYDKHKTLTQNLDIQYEPKHDHKYFLVCVTNDMSDKHIGVCMYGSKWCVWMHTCQV